MIYQSVLDRVSHVSTENMAHDEWLTLRQSFIGGSDVGCIMGLSNYGSAYTLYMEKKGKVRIEENAAMLRGSIMEPYIREITQKEFPNANIAAAPFIFQSKDKPFMGANVDGFMMVNGDEGGALSGLEGLGIHEIKSSQSGYGFSEDEIPDTYYAQVQHYMAVLDLPWALLTVYIIDKNKIRHYPIMRNTVFIADMIAQEQIFWEDFFLKDRVPAPIGIPNEDDLITGMFDGSASTLSLTEEELQLCQKINYLKAQIKPLEDQEKAAKIDLKAKLIARAKPSDTEKKLSAVGGSFSVSWSFFETRRVDSDMLKKAGLYEQYSTVTKSDRLTVSAKKGA